MADEKRDDGMSQDDRSSGNTGLSPLEEAMRIAEGKTLADAQAEKISAGAELPGIMEDLGDSVRKYTDSLSEWNQTESDRLADEQSRPFVESKERLDVALSQATENPNAEKQRLAKQTLAGWFQFKWGIGGMELPPKDAEAFADQIVKMVNNPKPPK